MNEPPANAPRAATTTTESRPRVATTLSVLAFASLVLAALAALVEDPSLPELARSLAIVLGVGVLGPWRVPTLDARSAFGCAGSRTLLALAALVLGHTGERLGFHATGHAVAQGLRALAVLLSAGAFAFSASPRTLAGLVEAHGAILEKALLGLSVLLTIGLALRELALARGEPLPPDALGFRQIAQGALATPFDTGYREPLHVWVVALLGKTVGDSDLALRGLTVCLSLAALAVFTLATRALYGRAFAAVAAFLYALSTHSARMSVLGLRTEEITLALVLVFWLGVRAAHPGAGWRDAALAGTAIGLAGLVYLSLVLSCLAWLVLLLLHARAPGKAALAALIAVLLVVPHLENNRRYSGDALETINRHAVFYRNVELQGRPGHPSREEVARDAYAGPRTTPFRYMFLEHAPGETAAILARGSARLATFRSPAFDAYRPVELGFVVWFLAVGGVLAIVLRRRERLDLVLFLVLATGPIVFLTGVFPAIEPRLTNQLLFAWLWAAGGLFELLRRRLLEGAP